MNMNNSALKPGVDVEQEEELAVHLFPALLFHISFSLQNSLWMTVCDDQCDDPGFCVCFLLFASSFSGPN